MFKIFFIAVGLFLLNISFAEAKSSHLPITNELITMVEHSANLKSMLVQSIESAKKINPDKKTNPAQSLEEYYDFIDWAAKALPWSLQKNSIYSTLYEQITQSIIYFYFITDQPLTELKDKGYYNNSLQYYEPYRSWMINFVEAWGKFLSTKESWNKKYLKMAEKDESFGLQKGWYEDPSHWKSFNDFFARRLKSPDMRPIASLGDDSIVVAPADSVPQGVWKINATTNEIESGVQIKSKKFESVEQLIGPNSSYNDAFKGGTLTHTFLDVNDYHRYHFPMSGTIKEIRIILADDAVGGTTQWDPKLNKYTLYSKTPGWQSIETRGCVILSTEKYGLVALMPIGMSQVSSVNFEKNVKVGAKVKKGDMLGYFMFGGSDFILLFQNQVYFDLTAPQTSDAYSHVLMGEVYGKLSLAPLP